MLLVGKTGARGDQLRARGLPKLGAASPEAAAGCGDGPIFLVPGFEIMTHVGCKISSA